MSATIDRDLQLLEADLKQLEAEYNMFFAGRLPRPPWETRGRVEALIKRWDRAHIDTALYRFRFHTLRSRFATFADLWDRGLRAREEGRPGPFAVRRREPRVEEPPPTTRVLHVTAFTDPFRETEKLEALYQSLMDARREAGEDVVPFHKFAALVKGQVTNLRQTGTPEVAFRVAVIDGKVNFTARGLKGSRET